MPDNELEDLEALVASPGWTAFRAYAAADWGPEAYRRKAQQILGSLNLTNGNEASSLLLQLESASREIERLLASPYERIKKLRGKANR